MRELSDVCSQIVFKKVCTWNELVDQTSHGQYTNLFDPSQNGWTQAYDRRVARLNS